MEALDVEELDVEDVEDYYNYGGGDGSCAIAYEWFIGFIGVPGSGWGGGESSTDDGDGFAWPEIPYRKVNP